MTKKKILVISDHPLSPSGVGTQTKYFIEALLEDRADISLFAWEALLSIMIISPQHVEPYGQTIGLFIQLTVMAIDEMIRSVLQKGKSLMLFGL